MRRTEGYCSYTERPSMAANYAWWSVELNKSVSVDLVSITLPIGEKDYPVGALVFVTTIVSKGIYQLPYTTCGIITNETIKEQNRATIFIRCNPHTRGDYIRIQRSTSGTGVLVLCEVQVFSLKGRESNLALGKAAVHNPPGHMYYGADRATDGNTNSNPDERSCSETRSNVYNAYWYVDLGGMYSIKKVEITIQEHSVSPLENGRIYVTKTRNLTYSSSIYEESDKCSDITGIYHGSTETFHCSGSLVGQFIYIVHTGSESLGLCEVRVYGDAVVTDTSVGLAPTTPRTPATSPGLRRTHSTDHTDIVTYTISSTENASFTIDSKGIGASDYRKTALIAGLSVTMALIIIIILIILLRLRMKRRHDDKEGADSTVAHPSTNSCVAPIDTNADRKIENDYEIVDNVTHGMSGIHKEERLKNTKSVEPSTHENLSDVEEKCNLYSVPDKAKKHQTLNDEIAAQNKPTILSNKPKSTKNVDVISVDYAQVDKRNKKTYFMKQESPPMEDNNISNPAEYSAVRKPKGKMIGVNSDIYDATTLVENVCYETVKMQVPDTTTSHGQPGDSIYHDTDQQQPADTDIECYNIVPVRNDKL